MKTRWLFPMVACLATVMCTDRPESNGSAVVGPPSASRSSVEQGAAAVPSSTGPSTVCEAFQEERAKAEAALANAPQDATLILRVEDLVAITADVCG